MYKYHKTCHKSSHVCECENRSLLLKGCRRGQKSVLTELDWANPRQSSETAASMRGRRQQSHQLELFNFRRSQEVRAEPCFPTRFQIRDAVLSMAHLNARFIVEVVNQQDGDESPVAIIADYPGNARVECASPSTIWIGLVELGIQYLDTRRRTVGNLFRRRNSLSLPMRPQIAKSESGPQQHNPGDNESDLPHPDLQTTHADCNTRFPRG